jgi:hypothetical protein
MKTPEKIILIDFLIDLERRFASDGSNDFDLKDTPENRNIAQRAEAWNVNCPFEDWEDHPDYHDLQISRGKIVTNNSLILGYLRAMLQNEVEERT